MTSEHSKLIHKLDRIFSEFIRLRYAKNGIVRCFTCGKYDDWRNTDCGHYIKRQNMATRYEEMNCKPQCKRCNWLLQGADVVFRQRLVSEYGEYKITLLEARKSRKIDNYILKEFIKKYTEEVKILKIKNGV